MIIKKLRFFILFCLLITLAACGFKPYGQENLPPKLHTIYYQSENPNARLEVALKDTLQTMGATIVNTPQDAPVTLRMLRTSFGHDNPNVTSSSQASIYNFTYSAYFDVIDKKGNSILAPQTVSSHRTLTLSPNNVIDTSNEVQNLQQDMQRELIFKIISVLSIQCKS